MNRTPEPPHRLRDGVSYGRAAAVVGCTKPHLFYVLRGDRVSKSLIDRLAVEGLLADQESGIGQN
jgi:hypothetical protein